MFRSIVRAVKADSQLHEVLGDVIRPQPEWWLNGDPYVSGQVNISCKPPPIVPQFVFFVSNPVFVSNYSLSMLSDRSTTREH